MQVIIGVLLLILQNTLAQPALLHILNGTDTKLGDYPYMAAIRRNEEDFFCGGALISNKHIITASHCVRGYKPESLTILLGTNDLLEGGDSYNVEKIATSKDFTEEHVTRGIAILTLSENVKQSQFVVPVALPTENVAEGTSVTLTGYGYAIKDLETGHMSQILQKLPVKIFNQKQCVELLAKYEDIQPSQVCGFTAPYYGACYGDSGSPLVHENTIVGVALSVYPGCGEGLPDVYARIYSYLDFIKQTIS